MIAPVRHLAALVASHRQLGLAARRRRVPRARPPTLIESDYAARIVDFVGRMRSMVERALPRLLIGLPHDQRVDEDDAGRGRREAERTRTEIDATLDAVNLDGMVRDIGRRVAEHHRGELERQAQAALGVEIFLPDGRTPRTIEAFVHENVKLIRRLQDTALADLEAIITRAFASGTRAEAVAEEISARFGIAARHARLIARDQIGKLTSQVTAQRHQELGLTSYKWLSLRRPTARKSHLARHGKRFRYDEPPPDGLPGMAICCGCQQHPVFDDLLALIPA